MVYSHLATDANLSLECNRLISSAAWMEMLAQGHVFPCIGPLLQEALIRAEQKRSSMESEQDSVHRTLDWEKLVRLLSQSMQLDWTGYDDDAVWGWLNLHKTMPDELWCKEIVWSFLGNMYVCDLLPRHESWMIRGGDPATVPRYWDETGQRVNPVQRLPNSSRSR